MLWGFCITQGFSRWFDFSISSHAMTFHYPTWVFRHQRGSWAPQPSWTGWGRGYIVLEQTWRSYGRILRWQDQSPKLAVADFTSCFPAGYLVSLERCGASIDPVSWFVVQEILPPRIGQWCTGCHNYQMLLPAVGRGWPVGYFAGRGEPSAWSKTHRHDWRAHQYHRR